MSFGTHFASRCPYSNRMGEISAMTGNEAQGRANFGAGPDVTDGGFTSTYRKLVRGKNINENTLLATDYLNHFNAIVMVIEMVPSMPECLEDAMEWRPKTYKQHFLDSGFAHRELAISAYENSPAKFRAPFDRTILHMNNVVRDGVRAIEDANESEDFELLETTVRAVSQNIRKCIGLASAIIHGDEQTIDQAQIDSIMVP